MWASSLKVVRIADTEGRDGRVWGRSVIGTLSVSEGRRRPNARPTPIQSRRFHLWEWRELAFLHRLYRPADREGAGADLLPHRDAVDRRGASRSLEPHPPGG